MVMRHGKPNCHGTPVLNLINVMVILKGGVRVVRSSRRSLRVWSSGERTAKNAQEGGEQHHDNDDHDDDDEYNREGIP